MSAEPTKVLWGMSALLSLLSTSLVNELRIAGFPDLIDGGIVFGEPNLKARKAPPSVVAMWVPGTATGAMWGPEVALPGSSLVQPVLNALATENLRLDFHCWASVSPPDPSGLADADACRYLYSQLWRVIHRGAEGNYRILSIDPTAPPPAEVGYHAVLKVEFSTPMVDNLIAYLPPGVTAGLNVGFQGAPASDTINVKTGALT